MAPTRSYYTDKSLSARFFDLVTAADRQLLGDIDMYAGLAPRNGSVLELGAGSGRVAVALAERGLSVVGVEIAPAMLAQAAARLESVPAPVAGRVELKRGDMTALNLGRTFDAVICPFFTLAHVPAGAAWRNTFAVAARHLAPGGVAAFHLPLIDVMRLPGPADADLPVLDLPIPDGRLLLYVRERRFREGLGRLDQIVEYVSLDGAGAVRRRSPERLTYYMADPEPFARAAGLAPDGAPRPLGQVGAIHVFRRA